MLPTEVWVLPRPNIVSYKGNFPLHFERKLHNLLKKPSRIYHPFGGKAVIGLRGDIKSDVYPDVVADAHHTPFKDNYFDVVICDPPYNKDYNKRLYSIDIPLRLNKWLAEAVRILKPLGFLVLYHLLWIPRPDNTSYWKRIIVLPGQNHQARICHIFQKEGKQIPEWLNNNV